MSKMKQAIILALALLGIPLAMAATDRILEGKYLRQIPGGGLVTVPNVTDTMVTRTATETLSNKTIIGSLGNDVWATRLMATSAPCAANQFISGITASGTTTCGTPAGGGDVSGPAASVDAELVLFNSTTGKLIKRAAGTGAVSVASGVVTQGTLTVPNGGTGVATIGSNSIVIGQGSSAVSQLTIPPSGYYARSNGTAWTTAAPNANDIFVLVTGNAAGSITQNTPVDFLTEVSDASNLFSSTTFTAPESRVYHFKGQIAFNASIGGNAGLYINGVLKATQQPDAANNNNYPFSFSWPMTKGDAATIRCSATGTGSNTATGHWMAITSQ